MPFRTKSQSRICCEHDFRSNESCFPELKLFSYPCLTPSKAPDGPNGWFRGLNRFKPDLS